MKHSLILINSFQTYFQTFAFHPISLLIVLANPSFSFWHCNIFCKSFLIEYWLYIVKMFVCFKFVSSVLKLDFSEATSVLSYGRKQPLSRLTLMCHLIVFFFDNILKGCLCPALFVSFIGAKTHHRKVTSHLQKKTWESERERERRRCAC